MSVRMIDEMVAMWNDGWAGRFTASMLAVCGVAVAFLVLMLGHHIWFTYRHPCVRTEVRRVPARTTLVMIGKVLVPRHRPAHDEDVCVERKR
jgi:hypothetical protein